MVEAVETLLALGILKTSEIDAFIAADNQRLEREKRIAALREEADAEFLDSYKLAYKSVELRLAANEGVDDV